MTEASPEARELSLISKVELRIALADSDSKLQALLNTYLAPLLLKLASDHVAVRNKVISICQHINTRIKPPSIQLPVAALLKQFKENKAPLVRHFDLLYIQQGIDRIEASARVDLLPVSLQGISETGAAGNGAGNLFNLVLRLLPLLKLPPRGSEADSAFREKLGISIEDAEYLSHWFGKLILLTPLGEHAKTCPALTATEYAFLNNGANAGATWDPSTPGGLNLTETKVAVTKFLASGAFINQERFLPAIFASADTNSRLSDIGDDMLKRFDADLEDPELVEQLFTVYFGTAGNDGAMPAKQNLQARILRLLTKSVQATRHRSRIDQLLSEKLFEGAANGSERPKATKLRLLIFEFITWVARMGLPADLREVAPRAIEEFRDFIVSQGWPNPEASGQRLSHGEASLRTLAYEGIGILAPKIDRQMLGDKTTAYDIDLLRWLLASLASDNSSDTISVGIEEALGSVLNAFAKESREDFEELLRPLLMHHMTLELGHEDPTSGYKVLRSTRFAAVRFANRCLPYADVQARWIDLMAVEAGSSERSEVVEEGKKGLDPYWYRMLNPRKDGAWLATSTAETDADVRYRSPKFQDLATFLFSNIADVHHSTDANLPLPERFSSVPKALAPAVTFCRNILYLEALSSSQDAVLLDADWEGKLDATILTKESARRTVKNHINQSDSGAVDSFLNAAISGATRTSDRTSADRCGPDFVELCSLTSDDQLSTLVSHANSLTAGILSNDRFAQEVSAHAFGILASHPGVAEDQTRVFFDKFMDHLAFRKEAIGQALNQIRGVLLATSYLLSRLAYRQRLFIIPRSKVQQFIDIVFEILEDSKDSLLREASHVAIGQLALSAVISTAALPSSESTNKVVKALLKDAKSDKESAISALGHFSLIFAADNGENSTYNEILNSLYSLHEVRRPEAQFAVGEAISVAAAGWSSKSLVAAFDVHANPPQSLISAKTIDAILEKVITDCKASKPSLRKAAAMWLLSLVQFCGHFSEVQGCLRRCQATFAGLLSDRDEIVQETGSRGLSIVYEMGDQGLKDDLVRDLVRSFTDTKSNLGGGKVTDDTELFEPGALPTGDGSVNTYKDIMSLASEVGDPSLVYRFMSLASNNAIWSSRAAFGRFGLSNVLSDSSVNGYLAQNPKLYPKLYRYRFDPNPNVQRSMNDIWNALVKDPNAMVDTHFGDIMEDLLKSIIAGREWRVRQASCAAIADLIQGRKVEKFDKYMSEILTKAFKVLDDIKESVRVAALRLCQVLANMVIRSLESGDSESKRAGVMMAHIVPFLLGQEGVESGAQEVQAYAISTITQIIKKSPSPILRPFVPSIMEKFLGSLSSLEPQAVNYVHLNADKYGMTGQEIDKMRLSSIRMSPMMEAIERYLLDVVDQSTMKELASRLEGVLRTAIGLPSKVGCSRVLVLLSSKPILFRPYADRFVQLLKKYVLDRNETVSASYSTSLGYLMRLASDEQILDLINFSKSLYFKAEDTSHRIISGEILRSASKVSGDKFMAFASASLPFVFVAKHDTDDQVKEVFDPIWKDNTGGSRAVVLYLKEILQLVSEHLESPRWAIKHTSAHATAGIVMSLDSDLDLTQASLIWPVLEKAISGKTWEGKEGVLRAFVRFTSRAKALWTKRKEVGDQMKVIIIREAKRNNARYRPHGLNALAEFAKLRDDLDLMPTSLDIVPRVLEAVAEDGDKMEIDDGPSTTPKVEDTLAAAVRCVLGCLIPTVVASPTILREHLVQAAGVVEQATSGSGNAVNATLYDELKELYGRFSDFSSDLSEIEGPLVELADRLLFRQLDLAVESVRIKRANAVLSFSTMCERAKVKPSSKSQQVRSEWLVQERSQQVLQVLRQSLNKS